MPTTLAFNELKPECLIEKIKIKVKLFKYRTYLLKPKSATTLHFLKIESQNGAQIYYLEIQFTKSRSNLLSRDRIYYLEIEFTILRSNLLSWDRIY